MSLADALAGLFQGGARGLGSMYQMEQDELEQKQRREDRADADRKWRATYDLQLQTEMNQREDRERDRLWAEQKESSDNFERMGIANALPAMKQLAGQGMGMGAAQKQLGMAAFDALKNADANRQLGRPLSPQQLTVDGQDTGAFYSPSNLSGGAGSGAGWAIKQDGRTNLMYRVHEASGQTLPLMMPDGKTQMVGMPNWAQTNPYNSNLVQTESGYQWINRPGFGPDAPRPLGVPRPAGGGSGDISVSVTPTGVEGVPTDAESQAQETRVKLGAALDQLERAYQAVGYKPPDLATQAAIDQTRQAVNPDAGVIATLTKTGARAAGNNYLKKRGYQSVADAGNALAGIVAPGEGGKTLTANEIAIFQALLDVRTGDTPEVMQDKFNRAHQYLEAKGIRARRAKEPVSASKPQVPTGDPVAELKKKYNLE